MSTANFYEVLQCSENASYEQLKCKYKQLVLQYHPDKLNEDTDIALSMPPSTSSSSSNNDERFHLINTAWNTLKDPIKRKLYDAELCQNRFQLHNNVFDRLRVADLEIEICNAHNDDDDEYVGGDGDGVGGSGEVTERTIRTYRCRCGGQYIVDDEAEIPTTDEDELLIECTECSLVIVLRR